MPKRKLIWLDKPYLSHKKSRSNNWTYDNEYSLILDIIYQY
jgi:hypothetical protein